MKKFFKGHASVFLFSFLMLRLTSIISFAQDSVASSGASATRSTTATTEHVTTIQPWVLIVGEVILLVIIIAFVSRNKGSEVARTNSIFLP
jgi:hypothetical protein